MRQYVDQGLRHRRKPSGRIARQLNRPLHLVRRQRGPVAALTKPGPQRGPGTQTTYETGSLRRHCPDQVLGSPSGHHTLRPLSPTAAVGPGGHQSLPPKSATPVELPRSLHRPTLRLPCSQRGKHPICETYPRRSQCFLPAASCPRSGAVGTPWPGGQPAVSGCAAPPTPLRRDGRLRHEPAHRRRAFAARAGLDRPGTLACTGCDAAETLPPTLAHAQADAPPPATDGRRQVRRSGSP